MENVTEKLRVNITHTFNCLGRNWMVYSPSTYPSYPGKKTYLFTNLSNIMPVIGLLVFFLQLVDLFLINLLYTIIFQDLDCSVTGLAQFRL